MIHKVIIIGSGPAGLTAGIYTARANLKPILIEGMQPGGQLTTTTKVENWPGEVEIMGPQLMMDMKNQAQNCGCQIISDTVEKVDFSKTPYKIFTKTKKELQAESVIIATGAAHRKLNIPGEKEYLGKGVSFCATCDAPFFKDKEVVVVGGGNSAVYEAGHLSHFAKKVTIVQILDKLTSSDLAQKNKVLADLKIEIILNCAITQIRGDGQKVTGIIIQNQKDKNISEFSANGVFIAIGLKPNSDIFANQIEIDEWGYIVRKKNSSTSKEGVFVAGDITDKRYKQAITAAGMGCMAAIDCQEFLNRKVLV